MIEININPSQYEFLPQSYKFIQTKEYKRFAEFCRACMEEKYIGICYGKPGIGKTLSARYYSKWDMYLRHVQKKYPINSKEQKSLSRCRTYYYTTPVLAAPKKTRAQVMKGMLNFSDRIRDVRQHMGIYDDESPLAYCKLVIIDEADRIKMTTLEELRDLYDHANIGMVLIGMPGIEKRLSRYPQFYSRIGFAHEYKLLTIQQAEPVIQHYWKEIAGKMNTEQKEYKAAVAVIMRISNGNFRLIQRLFKQIKRVLKINDLKEITVEVVEAARDCLVIGEI